MRHQAGTDFRRMSLELRSCSWRAARLRQAIAIGRVVISLAKVPVHHPVVASINRSFDH
jgi:hypothetical protein